MSYINRVSAQAAADAEQGARSSWPEGLGVPAEQWAQAKVWADAVVTREDDLRRCHLSGRCNDQMPNKGYTCKLPPDHEGRHHAAGYMWGDGPYLGPQPLT